MAINPKKHEMPTQEPTVRAHNFDEVALGYSEEIAIAEAQRCLNCKNAPCVNGCPVNIDIPNFISHIKDGDFEGAYNVISLSSSLPAVCGRVCPQETQCESKCTLGIKFEPVGIGRLERFVADWHNNNSKEQPVKPQSNGHKVAVVGSGPSGLTCAGDLAKKGYEVTVFEALHTAGGVLVYGIPEFRLPKSIVKKEVDNLKAMGADIEATEDGMIIRGGKALHGAIIDSKLDHRIAMSFAVAGMNAEGETEIVGGECVEISYPEFYRDINKLTKK